MNADRARRAHAIFTAALDWPNSEREARISEACGGDDGLASRVRKLLAASDRGTDFLESPALAGRNSTGAPWPDAVGDYLVVGVLGAGGMATVYEAVQENPNRRVALKVMRAGMSHTDALLRFRLEAETLARLQHPGIAQIYEAGSAMLGQNTPSPFFAMELVKDALTFTEYARRHALPLRRRLEMFASLCDAVLHGHQHGIIHRDLKPANVLVGADGLAKVIDFGIARATEQAPGGASTLTLYNDSRKLIGTLNYMSPEQCLRPEHIDIRADVYALGVMLYELVTDRLPHDLSACSIPEAVRVITSDDAPRASALFKEAAGDLDAIIAKAMSKDPEQRYAGADALAADVRRWLDHLPVEARPASAMDQMRKFVQRNRWLAASVAALFLSLVAGVSTATWLAYKAGVARDAALQRERELAIVSDFQESALRDINVAAMGDRLHADVVAGVENAARTSPEPSPGSLDAAKSLINRVNFTTLAIQSLNTSVLKRYADSIDARFAEQPLLRARLLQQLASTMNTLGLHAEAEPVLRDALETRRKILGVDHEDTLQSLHSLGSLLTTLGQFDEAIPLLRDAYQGRIRVLGPEDPMTLRAGTSLGGLHRVRGELPEAERIWTEVLAVQRRTLGDDDPDTLRTLNNMGVLFASQNKLDRAEACWRELLERRRRILGENDPAYLSSLGNLGTLLQGQGRLAEARPMLEQALAADRRRFGDSHVTTLVSMAQFASLLQDSGELAAAESLWRECLQGRVNKFGEESPATLRTKASLAFVLHLRGDDADALRILGPALEAQKRLLGDQHPDTIDSQWKLSEINSPKGHPQTTQP